ncbi:retrovirus-related pol polyprotein from transposon TNT 1-94 [Tanacetum coccineum]
MLDKTNYSSWARKPGNETTPATIRARTYIDLIDEEKIHELADIKAINIVLQELDPGLAIPSYNPFDDPIASLNKEFENLVQQENLIVNETLTAELERYKEQVKLFEQRQKFDLNDKEKYIDGQLRKTHDALFVTDTEETLELAEKSRLKMLAKQNDPSLKEKKVNLAPVDYFVDEYNETLVLKAELAKKNDISEKVVYNDLSKRFSRLENQCISLEIRLQQSKESVQTNRPSHNQDALEFKEFFIINKLQAQLKAKNVSIEKLKEHIANIKGKNVVDSVQNVHNSNVVTLEVYKLDLPPLSPCIKNNMAAHVDYLKHTQENADILREIIEHARELRPLDSSLASTCMFVTQIQELLVYVSATCPSLKHVSDKLVDVTPMNMTRKVSDYLNDVHSRVKSKSVKSRSAKSKKKKMWKPTGKVYANVGYSWKPTGRTFTIDGNTCPSSPLKSSPTAYYTENHSLIHLRYNKTPYELIHDKKPDLPFLHVFGSLCYSTNDSEDLGKLKLKANIGIFVGYVPTKKAFRIYNKITCQIMETIHVTFDELTTMASE